MVRYGVAVALVPLAFAACATATEPARVDDGGTGTVIDARSGAALDASGADTATATPMVDASIDGANQSASCTQAYAGVLATWSFSGASGSQTSTAAASVASGVTASAISRTGVTATSGSGSINASGWPTAAQRDVAKYYSFTITPPSGCTLTLTGAAIDGKASGTGPAQAVLATSDDSFATTITLSTSAATTPALAVNDSTGLVELRVYGFAASSTSGTFRLQNTLTLSGSLQ